MDVVKQFLLDLLMLLWWLGLLVDGAAKNMFNFDECGELRVTCTVVTCIFAGVSTLKFGSTKVVVGEESKNVQAAHHDHFTGMIFPTLLALSQATVFVTRASVGRCCGFRCWNLHLSAIYLERRHLQH